MTYAGLQSVSIDYGVMEKAKEVLVIPGAFDWSDLGSWDTLWEVSEKDKNGTPSGENLSASMRQTLWSTAPKNLSPSSAFRTFSSLKQRTLSLSAGGEGLRTSARSFRPWKRKA